jgi:hypothetical protein
MPPGFRLPGSGSRKPGGIIEVFGERSGEGPFYQKGPPQITSLKRTWGGSLPPHTAWPRHMGSKMEWREMKCPGQDTRYWTFDAIFDAVCPNCGMTVEFFKDETKHRCKNCGYPVLNPKMDFGCAAHCKFAENCLRGVLPDDEVDAQGRDFEECEEKQQ